MKVMPSGIILSITGISAFIIICAADFVLKKTLLKNKLRVYERDYFVLDDYDSVSTDAPEEALESNASIDEPKEEPTPKSDDAAQEEEGKE